MNPLLWPRWAQFAGIGVASALAFLLWLAMHDRGVIADHEAEVTKQVEATSSAAATVAASAAAETRSEVEKANDDARDAAAGSDDPLKSGLDRLRASPRPTRTPAR